MLIRDRRALKAGWRVAAVGLLAVTCGGRVETEAAPPSGSSDSGPASATTGGASGTDTCDDGGPGDAGCAGESALDPSTGIRTACGLSTAVRRNGPPVPLCFHIR